MIRAVLEILSAMFELILSPFKDVGVVLHAKQEGALRRRENASATAYCTGCQRNLLSAEGVVITAERHNSPVDLISCPCGDWSRWMLAEPVPLYLGAPIP